MISTRYTATTTPILIAAARPAESRWVYVESGANNVYLGDVNVTSATGLLGTKDVVMPFFLPALCSLYAVTASGSHPVTVMEPLP